MIEITCTTSAAKAAQWLAEARGTLLAAQELPRLMLPIERMLRAQTLAMRLGAMDSTARFFDGPLVTGLLHGYVIDWQADDDMCKSGEGLVDFCAQLWTIVRRVDEALTAWFEQNDYGSHRYAEERTGGAA